MSTTAPNPCLLEDEFASVKLGDKRLNQRVISIVEQCANKPTASLPKTFNTNAEVVAAYRFFDNENVTAQKILEPHSACAEQRARTYPVVLAIQDTTELNFNGQEIEGLGSLTYAAQRGMYLHATLLTSPARESLGIYDCWMWARDIRPQITATEPASKAAKASKKAGRSSTAAMPALSDREASTVEIESPTLRESARWVEGYERVADMAERLGDETRVVYVADREGDILALMKVAKARNHSADWVIRAKHNRILYEGEKLWDSVAATEPLCGLKFHMNARKGVKARPVTQEIQVKQVQLYCGIMATCLIASEINPPAGAKPVCWRLLTNRAVTTPEDALELIEWYRARWEIEIFFHVFKNGCTVEKMQLDHIEKIEPALAVYLVVAWRIMYLMRMGRTCPNLPADLFFDRDEIRAAYLLRRKKLPPDYRPGINEVLRMIAQMGGFLARKCDGEPGVKTIWQGMQDICVAVSTLQILREGGQLSGDLAA